MSVSAYDAMSVVRQFAPKFKARIGIVIGSGLTELAEQIEDAIVIPFQALPGIPMASVQGHGSSLVLGYIHGTPVACLKGRLHLYEGASYQSIAILMRILKLLGCESVIMTNSSGSLKEENPPGSILLIKDHINFQGGNPLAGLNHESFGPRFVSMENAYDLELREGIKAAGDSMGLNLPECVYISVLGPTFETPAEINMFRLWGAEVIGMSTVPDVIVARHCGLRVAVVSVITNYAVGMSEVQVTHEETLKGASAASGKLVKLILSYIETLQETFVA